MWMYNLLVPLCHQHDLAVTHQSHNRTHMVLICSVLSDLKSKGRQIVYWWKKKTELFWTCKGSAQQVINRIRHIFKCTGLVQSMYSILVIVSIWAASPAWWHANCPYWHTSPAPWHLGATLEGGEAIRMWLHVWSGGIRTRLLIKAAADIWWTDRDIRHKLQLMADCGEHRIITNIWAGSPLRLIYWCWMISNTSMP